MQTIKEFVIKAFLLVNPNLKKEPLVIEKMYKKYIKENKLEPRSLTRTLPTGKSIKVIKPKQPLILHSWSPEELLIMTVLVKVHKVELNDVLSISRKREVADCRKQAMALFYVCFDYSTVQVGRMFMRDHSTVIHAAESHIHLLGVPGRYKRLFEESIEELQKRVPEAFVRTHKRSTMGRNTRFIQLIKWEEQLR